jgi:DNA-binding response OmpR family regulator
MPGRAPDSVDGDRRGDGAVGERSRSLKTLSIQASASRRTVVYGPLVIDFDAECASTSTGEVMLQQSDWAILDRLAAAGGAFVRSADLLASVWGDDMRNDTAFLRAWVQRLNDRLGACYAGWPIIDTIPGGYRLCSPNEWNTDLNRITG